MDSIDTANERAEQINQAAIAAARAKPTGPVATGYCLHCNVPVAAPRRWCDANCRDLWQHCNER
jgi:hypothetical protein